MRILDRYVARQIWPVWFWCLLIFVFLSCLIDLFGHLDEILRYHISPGTVATYYLNFTPMVIVKASPFALLVGASFLTMQLTRYHELLAMNASGTSLLRSAVPFVFVGWLISAGMFLLNDRVVPRTSATYERLRQQVFRSGGPGETMQQVAILDKLNRIYHARALDVKRRELTDLTVLEHDWHNRPLKSLYASRAIYTPHGWLLLYGTIYRLDATGHVQGNPEPFVERLIAYPVTPASFLEPEAKPELMPFGQLRLLMTRLRHMGLTNLRSYEVELWSKLTMPMMNLVACLIGFVVSCGLQTRGHLRGLGMSVWGGCAYYLAVAVGQALGKDPVLPPVVAAWLPHLLAIAWCVRRLRRPA